VPRDERPERVTGGAGLRSARILRYAGEDSVGTRRHGSEATQVSIAAFLGLCKEMRTRDQICKRRGQHVRHPTRLRLHLKGEGHAEGQSCSEPGTDRPRFGHTVSKNVCHGQCRTTPGAGANMQDATNLRTLRVQVPVSLGRLLIAHSLPRFIHTHAGLRVQMRSVSSIRGTPAHDVDAAVCFGPIADSKLIVRQIGVVHSVTCASPEFIERNGSPQAPAELASTSCIGLLEPLTYRAQEWRFRRGRAAYAISPAAHMAFSDPECALAAAARDGGYVRVLRIEADRQIAAGLLQPVLEDWNEDCLPVAIVHSKDRVASDGIVAFGAFVAGLFPSTNRVDVDTGQQAPAAPGQQSETSGGFGVELVGGFSVPTDLARPVLSPVSRRRRAAP
jgi:DNA-binding transcriptional LysR family regulator